MDVRLPDGTVIQNVPDGTTKADLAAKLQRSGMAVPSEWLSASPEQPAAVQAGNWINGIPRQLGLTARYALEGPAQFAGIATEPIRAAIERLTGGRGQSLGAAASDFADSIGLPSPQTADERVIGDASRLVAGGGAASVAGRTVAAAPGVVGQVGQFFANNAGQQAVSAAGAGLAGGAAREAGASPIGQAGAAMLGGIAAPVTASALGGAFGPVKTFAKNLADYVAPGSISQQNVDQQISLVLRQQGIDWAAVPERVKQGMRAEVSGALATGRELNPDAVRRLLDFQRVGATPTRGMLTQDPVQITREMNLAKTGANSNDITLQRLPQLQSQNTTTLLNSLDNLGARNAPDAFATGQRVLDSLQATTNRAQGNINSLYSAARDTSGRSAPLDPSAFTRAANTALDEANVGSFLPTDIANKMNGIARGEIPLTVDVAEQLKTSIGNIQRATADGNVRRALGIVRGALDNTPLQSAPTVNPGNLPAVAGTVPASPAVLGQDSINAFNAARAANRQWMGQVESTPALAASIDGVAPDRFVQQFITGQGASVRDVEALRASVAGDPNALQAVRNHIVSFLRNAATNGTDDVTKFSAAAYNKALNNIGDRKLAAFFEPNDIEQLRSVGRVGTLMTAQPAGAAVNNSNSGALILGRGLDILDKFAGRLPLGLDTTITGVSRGVQQGRALNVPGGLLAPRQTIPLGQRIAPAAVYGGLLATQPID